jgi:uncharacterized protein
MESFEKIKADILNRLRTELPKNLFYHCPEHTEDVLQAAEWIAAKEGVSGEDLLLLKVAALFHDTGFLIVHRGHEEHSCMVARDTLPGYGFNKEQIDHICELIMATKLPQTPKDKLGEILCDADLDYLGRDDFFPIGNTLYDEMIDYRFLKDDKEWNRLQLKFLENHKYFTKTSIESRTAIKQKHLDKIKEIVASYEREGN